MTYPENKHCISYFVPSSAVNQLMVTDVYVANTRSRDKTRICEDKIQMTILILTISCRFVDKLTGAYSCSIVVLSCLTLLQALLFISITISPVTKT